MDAILFGLSFVASFAVCTLAFWVRDLKREIRAIKPLAVAEILSGFSNPRSPDFDKTYGSCKRLGFGERITAETCWNEGYRLGRERWFWGPAWLVSVDGWINTRIDRVKKMFQ